MKLLRHNDEHSGLGSGAGAGGAGFRGEPGLGGSGGAGAGGVEDDGALLPEEEVGGELGVVWMAGSARRLRCHVKARRPLDKAGTACQRSEKCRR